MFAGVAAEQPVFVHDQQAQPVTGFEQLRSWRVVRGANGVAAHVFQAPDAKILQSVGQGRADARMVLMVAGALDLIRMPVQ